VGLKVTVNDISSGTINRSKLLLPDDGISRTGHEQVHMAVYQVGHERAGGRIYQSRMIPIRIFYSSQELDKAFLNGHADISAYRSATAVY